MNDGNVGRGEREGSSMSGCKTQQQVSATDREVLGEDADDDGGVSRMNLSLSLSLPLSLSPSLGFD